MGVWLSYETSGPVPPEVAARIIEEAKTVGGDREWTLCEGLNFDPIAESEDGRLTGASKVLLREGRRSDDGDDRPHDLRVIVEALGEWSLRDGLAWALTIEGRPVGTVADGRADTEALEAIDALAVATLGLGARPSRAARALSSRPRLRIYRGPE